MFRILPLIALFCISACQSNTVKPVQPDWISSPGQGAVGSSVTHIKGRHYQEELAIARARERLAARYGVEISSVHTIKERVVNDKAYVTSIKQIEQAVKAQTVKARVRETWHDTAHDVIWVWVYPVN